MRPSVELVCQNDHFTQFESQTKDSLLTKWLNGIIQLDDSMRWMNVNNERDEWDEIELNERIRWMSDKMNW